MYVIDHIGMGCAAVADIAPIDQASSNSNSRVFDFGLGQVKLHGINFLYFLISNCLESFEFYVY